jgi:hypothetical protein
MKDKIMMLVFVLVLGTILTGILVAVNWYTTPVISRNEQREIQAGILQALGIPFAEEEVQQVFAASVQAGQALPSPTPAPACGARSTASWP